MGWLVIVATMSACPRRGPDLPDDGTFDQADALDGGIDERALAGSSLERAKRGLTPEEDGVLSDVHFGYDGHDLDTEARRVLAANTEWLRSNGGIKVELEGHCDDRGTIEYNLALGARRAKIVKDYLLTNGIVQSRIATISYGEELPVCHEQHDACWERNRRVHFVVLGQ
jgi:peptidoglycan-associated lipoprotein